MSKNTFSGILLTCALTVGHLPAYGGAIKLTTEELSQRADLVITGRVVSSFSRWENLPIGRIIRTHYTIQVSSTLKGTLGPSQLTVCVEGGQVEDVILEVSDTATLSTNEEVLLFLRPSRESKDIFRIVGAFQGKFSIKGERAFRKDLSMGLPLVDLQRIIREGVKR